MFCEVLLIITMQTYGDVGNIKMEHLCFEMDNFAKTIYSFLKGLIKTNFAPSRKCHLLQKQPLGRCQTLPKTRMQCPF